MVGQLIAEHGPSITSASFSADPIKLDTNSASSTSLLLIVSQLLLMFKMGIRKHVFENFPVNMPLLLVLPVKENQGICVTCACKLFSCQQTMHYDNVFQMIFRSHIYNRFKEETVKKNLNFSCKGMPRPLR